EVSCLRRGVTTPPGVARTDGGADAANQRALPLRGAGDRCLKKWFYTTTIHQKDTTDTSRAQRNHTGSSTWSGSSKALSPTYEELVETMNGQDAEDQDQIDGRGAR